MSSAEVSGPWSKSSSKSSSSSGHYTSKKTMGMRIQTDHHHQSNYHNSYSSLKSPVSRAITFGSPLSRDKMDKVMRDEMESIRWRDKSKWGFDFYAERPISPSSSSNSSRTPSPSPTEKSSFSKYEWKKNSSESLGYSYYGFKATSSSNTSCFNYKSTQTMSSSFKK